MFNSCGLPGSLELSSELGLDSSSMGGFVICLPFFIRSLLGNIHPLIGSLWLDHVQRVCLSR